MHAIFVSYRRDDSEGQAGRLYDDLRRRFGAESVFMDVADIEPGIDFRKAIDDKVASCGILLSVIGPGWLDAKDEAGRRRLDNPADFILLETSSALKRDIPVIPVLVHGAKMPKPEQLPAALQDLAFRNAIELTHARWDSDMAVLIAGLDRLNSGKQSSAGTPPTTQQAPLYAASVPPSVANSSPGSQREPKGKWLLPLVFGVIGVAVIAGGWLMYESPRQPVTKPLPMQQKGTPGWFNQPTILGNWTQLEPPDPAHPMRLRIDAGDPERRTILIAGSELTITRFNANGGVASATMTHPQGCAGQFRHPGYNYDGPEMAGPNTATATAEGSMLIYTEEVNWTAPCDRHQIGKEGTVYKLGRTP